MTDDPAQALARSLHDDAQDLHRLALAYRAQAEQLDRTGDPLLHAAAKARRETAWQLLAAAHDLHAEADNVWNPLHVTTEEG